ncbi:MAG: tetratricopeptide repeat protein [Bacteroidia bacterium]|nr:tetratricopeptide repeat protein [Bacteroidia bacterium]
MSDIPKPIFERAMKGLKILLFLAFWAGGSLVFGQNTDSLLQVTQTSNDPAARASAYQLLSRSYRNINLDSSAMFIDLARKEARAAGDKALYYRIENSAGALSWMQGDLKKADQTFRGALKYWESQKDSNEISRLSLNIGTVCQAQHKNEDAIHFYRKAYSIATQQRNKLIQAQSSGGIGIVFFQMREVDSMNYYHKRTLGFFREMNDSTNLGRTYTNLGLYNSELGNSFEARENYLKALDYLEGSSETGLIGNSNEGLGSLEFRTGNYDKAVKYFLTARKYYEKLGWKVKIASLNVKIGSCFDTWGRTEAARAYFRMAYESAAELKEYNIQAAALASLAGLNLKAGAPAKAIDQYRESISISQKAVVQGDNFSNHLGLGRAFHQLGQEDSATSYLSQALADARDRKNETQSGAVFLEMARLKLDKQLYPACLQLLDSSETWYSITRQSQGIHDVNLLRSQCYEGMGDFVKALNASREADRWRDSMFTQSSTEQLLELEARYWSERKEYSLELATKNEALRAAEAERALEATSRLAAQRNMLLLAFGFLIVLALLLYYLAAQRRKNRYKLRVSEMRLQTMRAQMNPHFIFNALGSVQMLINTQNVKEANLYLSKFARLLRGIMETSSKTSLTVEQEKEVLELYIELEALRFKFNYEILVDENLESSMVQIPAMVIQPFVENAIKHGMQGVAGKGRLLVQFLDRDQDVLCIVEDNGVGREAAAKNSRPNLSGLSISTGIIRERLRLMSPSRTDRLKITDVMSPEGDPCGTRVEIYLPKI